MWREVGTAFMYHCVKFIQPLMCILRVYLSVYLEVVIRQNGAFSKGTN